MIKVRLLLRRGTGKDEDFQQQQVAERGAAARMFRTNHVRAQQDKKAKNRDRRLQLFAADGRTVCVSVFL